MKKLKPETEIRNLKKRVKELEMLCEMAGVPLLVVCLPELVLKGKKPDKESIKWAKEKVKEYNQKFN